MRKIVFFLLFLGIVWAERSPLFLQLKSLSLEQMLQRKHIEQMHFQALSSWRVWGVTHAGIKQTFIGERSNYTTILPQVGADKELLLNTSTLFVGFDVNADITSSSNATYTISSYGYGVGGYAMWLAENGWFATLSAKMAQLFSSIDSQNFNNTMWLFDAGMGKTFFLPQDYYLRASFNFGSGVLFDSKITLSNLTQIMDPTIPFSLLGVFSIGKQIGKQDIRIDIASLYENYAGGKVTSELASGGLEVASPKANYDLKLSIHYDIDLFDGGAFYTYADFSTLNLEVMAGLGFRMEFGVKESALMKYPTIRLKKLHNTDIK